MKLAYLSESRIPSREANAVHVMKMCQAFARLGHDVTLVAAESGGGSEPGVADPFAFYGVEPIFRMRRLPWRPVKGRAWIYGWQAGRLARRLGVDMAFGRSLQACAVAAQAGIPTAWDAHMPTFLRVPHERWLFRRMIKAPSFRGMMTNSGALAREVEAEIPEIAGRIRAAHNGADPVDDGLRPADLGETGGRLQVGYVGQLYAGKGMELIGGLAAAAPWADFHVVGGNEPALAALRSGPPLPVNIRLHGFVPPAATTRLILAFDVLLAPYQRQVEISGGGETAAWMSPLKMFSYMAAGKPILCSDLPVLHEIAEPGRNAILLPPDDVGAWAAALRRLAEDPGERARLGAAALADFRARYTWQRRAEIAIGILGLG